MFMDERRSNVWDQIRQHGLRSFEKLLPTAVFGEAGEEANVQLGTSPLRLPNLAWLAIASVLHPNASFATVLTWTLRWLMDSEGWNGSELAREHRNGLRRGKYHSADRSKHDPRGTDPTVVSEEAFAQARQRVVRGFWLSLLMVLTRRFQAQHDKWLRWNDFRLMAIDGTQIDLPNWKALGDHYGRAKNGSKEFHPQARMVMLQFPLARIPWRYELCPLHEGERTIAGRLLNGLKHNDLVLMDQGFWSYGLFWQIQEQGASFAVRLFPNVNLKTRKKLGPKDRLVDWSPSDRKWKQAGLPGSIRLRVIDYQIPGFRPAAVVTSVLDPERISRDQWVHMATADEEGRLRLAQGLYHRRWEIETTFSELKVVQGLESSLRSRTPKGIQYEISGQVLFYLLLRWLMVEAAEKEGADPLRISFKHAYEAVQEMMPLLVTSSLHHVRRVLYPRLLQRIVSHRLAFRPGRHDSRPKDTKPKNLGYGKIRQPHKLTN